MDASLVNAMIYDISEESLLYKYLLTLTYSLSYRNHFYIRYLIIRISSTICTCLAAELILHPIRVIIKITKVLSVGLRIILIIELQIY